MSLATICRAVAVRCGVAPANVWASSGDDTAREIVEFANEALRTVAEAHEWQALLRTHSAPLTADAEQTVPLPADFARLVPGTVWLEGNVQPVRGPVTEHEFEMLRLGAAGAAWPVFRLAGGALDLLAAPTGGSTLSFRYITAQPVSGGKVEFTADADAALVDERLIVLAAVVLWRDAKGLPAPVAMAQYAGALARAKAADRPVGVMGLGGPHGARPGTWAASNGTAVSAL